MSDGSIRPCQCCGNLTLPYRAPSSPSDLHVSCQQVVGAPIAAALLALDGLFGIAGWQYLFLLEGAMAAAVVEACCCFPADIGALKHPSAGSACSQPTKAETHVVRK